MAEEGREPGAPDNNESVLLHVAPQLDCDETMVISMVIASTTTRAARAGG